MVSLELVPSTFSILTSHRQVPRIESECLFHQMGHTGPLRHNLIDHRAVLALQGPKFGNSGTRGRAANAAMPTPKHDLSGTARTAAPEKIPPFTIPGPFVGSPTWQSQTGRGHLVNVVSPLVSHVGRSSDADRSLERWPQARR